MLGKTKIVAVCSLLLLATAASAQEGPDLIKLSSYGPLSFRSNLELHDDYAYVITDEGLTVIDVSDPSAPILATVESGDGDYDSKLIRRGTILLVREGSQFQLFSVTEPASPQFQSAVIPQEYSSFELSVYDISLSVDRVSLLTSYGLMFFDITSPESPAFVAESELQDIGEKIEAIGDTLYMISSQRFSIYDISNPTQPMLIGELTSGNGEEEPLYETYDFGTIQDLQLSPDAAWISSYGGIFVVDITDPTIPRFDSTRTMPGYCCPGALFVDSTKLYIANVEGGVEVINFVDSTYSYFGTTPYDVVARDSLIFVLGSDWQLSHRSSLLILTEGEITTGSVMGTITEAGSGTPMQYITVSVYQDGLLAYTTSTDAAGTYHIWNLESGSYNIVVEVAEYYVYDQPIVAIAGETTQHDIQLEKIPTQGSILARVFDSETYEPIPWAQITISASNWSYMLLSDDQGEAAFPHLLPNVPHNLVCRVGGYYSQTASDIYIIAGEITIVEFALDAIPIPGTLSGTVIDLETTAPAEGVRVTVASSTSRVTDGITGTDGTFTISNVLPGVYTVVASKRNYIAHSKYNVQIISEQITDAGTFGIQEATNFTRSDVSCYARPSSIASSDIDSDNDIDLVVANKSLSSATILKNSGTGTFTTSPALNFPVGSEPQSVCLSDIDGDSDKDLLVACWGSNSISVLQNAGDGTLSSPTSYDIGDRPSAIASSDIDNDEDPDIIVAKFGDNTVSVLLNNGDGTYGNRVDYEVGGGPLSVFISDLDGDGSKDIAVAAGAIYVLLNNGDGTFGSASSFAVGSNPRSISGSDFDGDGDTDMVAACWGSFGISILLNMGDGTFHNQRFFSTGVGGPRAVGVSDFDGDGDQDVAVACFTMEGPWIPEVMTVLMNDGSASFSLSGIYSVGLNPEGIVCGDFNDDNESDIAVGNYLSSTVSVMLNGGFEPPQPQEITYAWNLPTSEAEMGSDYAIHLQVTNHSSTAQYYNFSLLESSAAVTGDESTWWPWPEGTSQPGTVDPIIPDQHVYFVSHEWDWIPPFSLGTILEDVSLEVLDEFAGQAIGEQVPIGTIASYARLFGIAINAETDATFVYTGVVSGHESEIGEVTVSVPDSKMDYFLASSVVTMLSPICTVIGTANILWPAGWALIVAEGVLIPTGWVLYDIAADPPDPEFAVIVQPIPVLTPELDTLQASIGSGFAYQCYDLYAVSSALLSSIEKYRGAKDAGDLHWQAIQLESARTYSQRMLQILRSLSTEWTAIESEIGRPSAEAVAAAKQSLLTEGLPEVEVSILRRFGVPEAVIDALPSTIASFPDEYIYDEFATANLFNVAANAVGYATASLPEQPQGLIAASLDAIPDTVLLPIDVATELRCYLEIENSDPSLIVSTSLLFNDTIVPSLVASSWSDYDLDGIPDLELVFNSEILESISDGTPGNYLLSISGITVDGSDTSLIAAADMVQYINRYGAVTGTVLDASHNALAGITIDVFDKDGVLYAITATDAEGSYHIDSLDAGMYTLTIVTPLGYQATSETKQIQVFGKNFIA